MTRNSIPSFLSRRPLPRRATRDSVRWQSSAGARRRAACAAICSRVQTVAPPRQTGHTLDKGRNVIQARCGQDVLLTITLLREPKTLLRRLKRLRILPRAGQLAHILPKPRNLVALWLQMFWQGGVEARLDVGLPPSASKHLLKEATLLRTADLRHRLRRSPLADRECGQCRHRAGRRIAHTTTTNTKNGGRRGGLHWRWRRLGRGGRRSRRSAVKDIERCELASVRLLLRALRKNRVVWRCCVLVNGDNLSDHLLAGAGRIEDDIAARVDVAARLGGSGARMRNGCATSAAASRNQSGSSSPSSSPPPPPLVSASALWSVHWRERLGREPLVRDVDGR